MPVPSPARSSSWLPALLVFLAALVAVSAIFHRWSWLDWTTPYWIVGDPLEVYARAKIAANQPWDMLVGLDQIEALGAPLPLDWTGYPTPDRIVFALTGWASRVVGLVAAIQMMSAVLLGLNAVSFYLCARWLRWRWEWAAALALAFALCTYNFRWGITLSFNQTFSLPPLVLLCARAARPGVRLSGNWILLGGVLGLWLGQGNPYFAYFTGIIAGGTLLLAWRRRVPPSRLWPLLVFLAALTVCFFSSNSRHILQHLAGSGQVTLVRSLDDMRTYALRPIEWLVPPADHRLPLLGEIGRRYHLLREAKGEFFYNYLGLAGVVGLLGLLLKNLPRQWPLHRRLSEPLLGLLWICAFGVAGGLNYWFGALGLDVFRAGTRIGIFAQIWCLLFLGSWLNRHLSTKIRPLSVSAALLLAVFTVWDQTPPLGNAATLRHNASHWSQYASLAEQLERQLPARGMIFQLPVVPFPEAGPAGAMPDYEHFLPFLASHSLRYSYGQLRSAPIFRWSRHVDGLPLAEKLAALEQAGVSALWVDTRAYADAGTGLLTALQAAGRQELALTNSPAYLRVFKLNPARVPVLPDVNDPRLSDPWDKASPTPLPILALQGWYPVEAENGQRWRWAGREATLGLWSDRPAQQATLHFRVGGPSPFPVALHRDRQEIWRASPGPTIHHLTLELKPGLNSLVWQLQGATFKPGGNDPRALGFMIENLTVSVP